MSDDGGVLGVDEAGDAGRLVGAWRVVALDGEDVADLGPSLTFDGDRQVYGMAGVNRVRGTWTLADGTLTFGPVVATLMAGPPRASACERRLLALLAEPLRVVLAGDDLTLTDPDGSTAHLTR